MKKKKKIRRKKRKKKAKINKDKTNQTDVDLLGINDLINFDVTTESNENNNNIN